MRVHGPRVTAVQIRQLLKAVCRTGARYDSGATCQVSGPGGAARLLGLKPTTLASRIKALGIRPQSARNGKRI